MGQKDINAKVEKLTGRVTALENGSPASDHGPHRMRGATFYMSLVSLIVTVIGVPIMFLAWIEPHLQNDLKNDVKIEVTEQLKDPLKQIGEIAGDVREIKGKLEVLDPLIRDLTMKRIGEAGNLNTKELVERLPELRHLATIAKTESIAVSPKAVEKVGKKLIEAGSADAWGVALNFAAYKSFLNADFMPAVTNPRPLPANCGPFMPGDIHILRPTHESSKEAWDSQTISGVGRTVGSDEAARMEALGRPFNENDCGSKFIIFRMPRSDNALLLDGLYLKNVIIQDTRVSYRGGPVRLENVFFVNCTFDIQQESKGQVFANAILAPSPSVTLTLS
ncbi:MAG: hypothetical protein ABSG07_21885 [Terriglobales bacterium]|jgi:hypothetical protein